MPVSCPPHWSGDACEWPICANGRVDSATKECVCRSHFAPPFCERCFPGWWGANCDKPTLSPIDDDLSAADFVVPYLSQAVVLISIVILITGAICGLRLLCRSRSRPASPLRRIPSIRGVTLRSLRVPPKTPTVPPVPPPAYEEAIILDPPPPYTV